MVLILPRSNAFSRRVMRNALRFTLDRVAVFKFVIPEAAATRLSGIQLTVYAMDPWSASHHFVPRRALDDNFIS
jgi:hypothetical protein